MFRLAYNTNGLAHHRPEDALRLLADLGYEGVALTPDTGGLDLYDLDPRRVARLRRLADERGLELAVETGARYLMDPARKHFPTLLEADPADRARRVDFYRRSIDLAAELGAEVVSLWAGAAPDGSVGDGGASGPAVEELWWRLGEGLAPVLEHARARGVQIGFEPEPGMFVERPVGYLELVRRLGPHGTELGLTLDVGHLIATNDLPGDVPIEAQLSAVAERLVHVHLDDARPGIHEHLAFGAGVLDLRATLNGLARIGYGGMAAVELSRDSHRGPAMAAQALSQIRAAFSHAP